MNEPVIAGPGREAVIADLRARLPLLTQASVAQVRDAVPAYRDLTGDQLSDVHAITGWVIDRMLRAWAEQPGFDDDDRTRFRAIGAARAEDGRPITSVLRAYRVAAIGLADAVRVVGGDRLDLDDLGDLSIVLLTGLDELSEALIAGHTACLARLNGDRDRARRDLLDDLLSARQSSAAAAEERSRLLGVDLPTPSVLVVAESTDAGVSLWPPAIDSLTTELGPPEPQTGSGSEATYLSTARGRHAVLLLPAGDYPILGEALRIRGWRGCTVMNRTIADLAGSYRLAVDALDTAPDNAFHGRALLDEGDAQLLALLSAKPAADPDAVVLTILGPLAEASNAHLLEGLAAFLATGSATAAASHLQLHPQTLRYRLRRARRLTARDPNLPWQRLALDVARQLHQIRRRSTTMT